MTSTVDLMLILLTHIQIEKERIRNKQQKKLKALWDYGILIYILCVHLCGVMYAYRSQRSTLDVFTNYVQHYFFEAGSLTEHGVCQQAGLADQSLCCYPPSRPHPSSHGCWDLNTGIHISEPNVFPTKPSSQPQDDGYFYYLDNDVVSWEHLHDQTI